MRPITDENQPYPPTISVVEAEFFLRHLSQVPILAILRGHSPQAAVQAAEACWAAGIELVEVSLSEDGALDSLEAVCRRAKELDHLAGAGTILAPPDVEAAVGVGAQFGVAPALDPDVVKGAEGAGLPLLPGVTTPSEVQRALALGCQVLKLFPAHLLGPNWIRAMRAPFPAARFVAVGGVSDANGGSFLTAGAVGLGIGSALDLDRLDALVAAVATRP